MLTHLHDGIVADDSTDDDDAMPMIWMTAHLIAMTLSMDMISVVMLLLLVMSYLKRESYSLLPLVTVIRLKQLLAILTSITIGLQLLRVMILL